MPQHQALYATGCWTLQLARFSHSKTSNFSKHMTLIIDLLTSRHNQLISVFGYRLCFEGQGVEVKVATMSYMQNSGDPISP